MTRSSLTSFCHRCFHSSNCFRYCRSSFFSSMTDSISLVDRAPPGLMILSTNLAVFRGKTATAAMESSTYTALFGQTFSFDLTPHSTNRLSHCHEDLLCRLINPSRKKICLIAVKKCTSTLSSKASLDHANHAAVHACPN